MDEIFKTMAPATVKILMDEMFTGYINSPLCAPLLLGEMYELKRMITIRAKEYEHRSLKVTAKQG